MSSRNWIFTCACLPVPFQPPQGNSIGWFCQKLTHLSRGDQLKTSWRMVRKEKHLFRRISKKRKARNCSNFNNSQLLLFIPRNERAKWRHGRESWDKDRSKVYCFSFFFQFIVLVKWKKQKENWQSRWTSQWLMDVYLRWKNNRMNRGQFTLWCPWMSCEGGGTIGQIK